MARKITLNPLSWFKRSGSEDSSLKKVDLGEKREVEISPGRVSVPDVNADSNFITWLRGEANIVTPSFVQELIPLIRKLYKVNPDVSIAIQDMFKLANTGHTITFPLNTEAESKRMLEHLEKVSKTWVPYTAGIDGIGNRLIVQAMVGGAMSFEAVPNDDLTGISHIVFLNPENIRFQQDKDGRYSPYQLNKYMVTNDKPMLIKLNPETYKYISIYNDTDEPYGIPPFMAALDSIKGQHDMRINFKHIMEQMGMLGFLEAKIAKPDMRANEKSEVYNHRLTKLLRDHARNLRDGMKDGLVVGYTDDHEFEFHSTTKDLGNVDRVWAMNEQGVANGLGVSSSLIGVGGSSTETGVSIMLSKMISQLKNLQTLLTYALVFIYTLELRLAGFNVKKIKIEFATTTIADELKVQQGIEYKIRNLCTLYDRGIISQQQFASAMGYDRPDQAEPRVPLDGEEDGVGSTEDSQKKRKRENDKDTSDRKTRDKNNPAPKRRDQDSRPTGN